MPQTIDRIAGSPGVSKQDATEAIAVRARGAASRLLGLSRLNEFQALVVSPRCPMRRAWELRDRRVGLPSLAGSRPARAAALRGALSAVESGGLNHRHVDWVELMPDPDAEVFSAELQALENHTVDAVYVRGAAGLAAIKATGARVLFDIGVQRDPWLRGQTALLIATVTHVPVADSSPWREPGLDEETLQVAHELKHFLLRWEFILDDFDLRCWAHVRPQRPAGRFSADVGLSASA